MKMYVSNLGYQVNDDVLKKLFEEFGEVSSAKVIIDRETGRSRGFGFVEMASDEQAKKAMGALDNKSVESRNISVSVARERESQSPKSRW